MEGLMLYHKPEVLFFSFEKADYLYMRVSEFHEDDSVESAKWYRSKIDMSQWNILTEHDTAMYENAYQEMLLNGMSLLKFNLLD